MMETMANGDENTANRIVHKIDGIARDLWHYECTVVAENQLVYATDIAPIHDDGLAVHWIYGLHKNYNLNGTIILGASARSSWMINSKDFNK